MEAQSPAASTGHSFRWQLGQWASGIFGLDLRSLAVFRIGMGLMLLCDLVQRSRDLVAHYTDAGVLPSDQVHYSSSYLHFHDLNGSLAYEATLFSIAGVFAAMLLVGYWTRVATIVSWAFLCSVQARNTLSMDSGQDLLRLLLFWSMFLPLGARYSLDSAMRIALPLRPNRIVSAATVALMVQVVGMYFFASTLKTSPEWRVDGSAVYYTMRLDMLVTPFGRFLLNFPSLLRALTFLTIGMESMSPILFFFPWRNSVFRCVIMVLLCSMHLGFVVCMHIEIFPWICIFAWMAFLPSDMWDYLAERMRMSSRRGLALYYDPRSSASRRLALMLRTFLILPSLRIRRMAVVSTPPNAETPGTGLSLVDGQDHRYDGHAAVLELVRRSAVFWPLAWLLSTRLFLWIGNALLRLASVHRDCVDCLTGWLCSWRPLARRIMTREFYYVGWTLVQGFVAIWIYYVLAYNIHNATADKRADQRSAVEEKLYQISHTILFTEFGDMQTSPMLHRWNFLLVGRQLRLEQWWSMFAPGPLRRDGWYVLAAQLVDGSQVDLWTGAPVHWNKPLDPAGKFPNYRWYKYMERFIEPTQYTQLQAPLCHYFCRQWNQAHEQEPGKQVKKLQIFFVVEFSEPPYYPERREPVLITQCDGDTPGK